jgi:sigma-E factor negative regulatory protein RseB
MKAWLGFCGLLLALNAGAADGQSKLDLLKTIAYAGHQTDYSGIFVYQYGNHVETSRISHIVDTDGEYEKLEGLDGPKREIIRHHGQVWCYSHHKMVQVESRQGKGRFPQLLPEQLSALIANYSVKELGSDRVAGYETQIMLFQPKDKLRYSQKIWVDMNTGLLLKAAVLNEKNQIVEQYAFTELKLGKDADRAWINSNDIKGLPGMGQPDVNKAEISVNSGWVVDALPSGFKKTMELLRPMHGNHAPVIQLVYSDGLSAISVFVEPVVPGEEDNEGLSSRGAMNLYHKVVGDHLFHVVGEVPPMTVIQVLNSIRYNEK